MNSADQYVSYSMALASLCRGFFIRTNASLQNRLPVADKSTPGPVVLVRESGNHLPVKLKRSWIVKIDFLLLVKLNRHGSLCVDALLYRAT